MSATSKLLKSLGVGPRTALTSPPCATKAASPPVCDPARAHALNPPLPVPNGRSPPPPRNTIAPVLSPAAPSKTRTPLSRAASDEEPTLSLRWTPASKSLSLTKRGAVCTVLASLLQSRCNVAFAVAQHLECELFHRHCASADEYEFAVARLVVVLARSPATAQVVPHAGQVRHAAAKWLASANLITNAAAPDPLLAGLGNTSALSDLFPKATNGEAIVRCSECRSDRIIVDFRNKRSADEGQDVFLQCERCFHRWHLRA